MKGVWNLQYFSMIHKYYYKIYVKNVEHLDFCLAVTVSNIIITEFVNMAN